MWKNISQGAAKQTTNLRTPDKHSNPGIEASVPYQVMHRE